MLIEGSGDVSSAVLRQNWLHWSFIIRSTESNAKRKHGGRTYRATNCCVTQEVKATMDYTTRPNRR